MASFPANQSYFDNHSTYDYKPNWTPLGPITPMNQKEWVGDQNITVKTFGKGTIFQSKLKDFEDPSH